MKHFYLFSCNLFLVIVFSGFITPAWGQLSLNNVNTVYTVDFDNTVAGVNNGQYGGSGFTPGPGLGQLDSDAWEITGLSDGTLNYGGTGTTGDFARGASTGGETQGGIYAFDVGGGNLTLGFQATDDDMTPGVITLRVQNNTGVTIKGLDIDYRFFVFNDAERASTFDFAYSTDNISYINEATHITTEASTFAIWQVNADNANIQSLDILPGDFFYLRWTTDDAFGTGGRDEITLDDIQVQVTSSITYATGDWRPAIPNVAFNSNGDWERFDGTNWIAQPDAPETAVTIPTRIIIDQTGITGGNPNVRTYNDIVIVSGADLTINIDDATIAGGGGIDYIAAGATLEAQNLAILSIEGDIGLNAGANLVVRGQAMLIINQNSITNTHPFWNGIENFESNSLVEVRNWNWATSPSLLASTSQISTNANGYIFGAFDFEATPTADFSLTSGQQGTAGTPFRLVENDLTINNISTSHVVSISGANTDSYFMVNGNVFLQGSGEIALFAAGGAVTHTLNITGRLVATGFITFKLSGDANTVAVINLMDDLTVTNSVFSSDNTDSELNFAGSTSQLVNIIPNISNVDFYVKNGAIVQLFFEPLKFNGSCSMTVETGGDFNFGYNLTTPTLPLTIIQSGGAANTFASQTGSILRITSPDGIHETATDGNLVGLPASNRTINKTATFIYIGNGATQVTGDGIGTGSTAKNVIVQLNTGTVLTPSGNIGISAGGSLDVRSGTLSVPDFLSVSGTGDLIMSGGELQLAELGSTLPELTGTYTISGGSINLNGAGNQGLRGGQDYSSLIFSGSGTKTLTSALTAGGLEGNVSILGDAILDIANRNFDGTASLTMANNARLRISRLNETLPELTGAYNLNDNSVIELYGTGSTQTHSLRGGVTYNNIEINADAANEESGEANVITSSSFAVTGTLLVNAPATFQVASTFTITGTSFELADGAGLKYGSTDGIVSFGAFGNIRTTSRSFSSNADYYLVGGVAQVTGSGLPGSVRKLVVDKTANDALLSQTTQVNQELRIVNQHLDLNGNDIRLDVGAFLNEDRANNHIVVDNSAPDGGDGLIIANGRTYDEAILTDIAGLGLFLQRNTPGTVEIDIQRGHQRVGNINLGIRKFFDVNLVSGDPNESTMQFHYADEDYTSITDLVGDESSFTISRFTTFWADGFGIVDEANNLVQYNNVDAFSTWTVTSTNFPLPFTLLSFDVKPLPNNQAQVQWTTAQELNNQGFGIEKSIDGISFEEISFVEAAGEGGRLQAYDFMDYNFYESAYYRLRQVDLDGRENYTPVVFAEHPEEFRLDIYPNPVVDEVNIFLATEDPVRMSLIDMRGQAIWQQRGDLSITEQALNQQLSGLTSGAYWIRIQTSERVFARKIILNR